MNFTGQEKRKKTGYVAFRVVISKHLEIISSVLDHSVVCFLLSASSVVVIKSQ